MITYIFFIIHLYVCTPALITFFCYFLIKKLILIMISQNIFLCASLLYIDNLVQVAINLLY